MVALLNLLKFFTLSAITTTNFVKSVSSGNVDSIEFIINENDVLRKENDCNIVFINFGMDENIRNLRVSKIIQDKPGKFNLIIENLINGNMGSNNVMYLKANELKSAIQIHQNEREITNFELSDITKKTGLMNMENKSLSTWDGFTLKQTFKESLINVVNRIYYQTFIPPHINQGFDAKILDLPIPINLKKLIGKLMKV